MPKTRVTEDVKERLISLIRQWDDLYRNWSDLTISYCGGVHAKHRFSPREDWFRPWLNSEDVVIDLGCAHGKILHALAPFIRRGIGLDHNAEHIRTARSKFQAPNIKFYEGDIEANPWPFDDRADVGILSHVLEHVEDSVGLLRRLKTPRVIILVPSTDDWISRLKHELGYDRFRDEDHKREYGREDLVREVEEAGFTVTNIQYTETGNLFCVGDRREGPAVRS